MGVSDIIDLILEKRGIPAAKRHEFLHPPSPASLQLDTLGVSDHALSTAIGLIGRKRSQSAPIVVYGDYDADGITATAILWEILHYNGIPSMPFIPHRLEHGYGLSRAGLQEVIAQFHPKLIVAVDNGITAHEATTFARRQGISVIVIDHHHLPKTPHPADAVIHSTGVSGAGLTWLFAHRLQEQLHLTHSAADTLELAAIGTVADLVPLTGASRSIVASGLARLRLSTRPGLVSLTRVAGVNQNALDAYHLGFQIGPRLNAMGRLQHAVDALRLLCTTDPEKAHDLATILDDTNRSRQKLTDEMTEAAMQSARAQAKKSAIVVSSEEFHEGIIGLVAGKIAQIFWRPTIVIANKGQESKASARSIPGFNLIEAIRELEPLLSSVGGHPMAAGFTIASDRIEEFATSFIAIAAARLTPELLTRSLPVDVELRFPDLTDDLASAIETLEPFGIGNPRPMFQTPGVTVTDVRAVGQEKRHLKLRLRDGSGEFSAIAFGQGELAEQLSAGDSVTVAYHLKKNTWNNQTNLELHVKRLTPSKAEF